MRIVEVTWEDACRIERWEEGDAFPTTYMCRSVGYQLHRGDGRIVVAADLFDEDGSMRLVRTIPDGMVRKVRRLA